MKQKNQTVEGAPNLILSSSGRGNWRAKVSFTRELRNHNYENVELTFTDVDLYDLRCLARTLHGALDDIANDYTELKKAMDVSHR